MATRNQTHNFFLCVDDFGIKYYTKSDAQHLLDTIGKIANTQQIGLAATIVDSPWIGIINKIILIYLYLAI